MNKVIKFLFCIVLIFSTEIILVEPLYAVNYSRTPQKKKSTITKRKPTRKETKKEKQMRERLTLELTPIIKEKVRAELEKELNNQTEEKIKLALQQQFEDSTKQYFSINAITHENILSIRGGWYRNNDQYLSPNLYTGYMIGLKNEWWQNFKKNNNWGHVGDISISVNRSYNTQKTNRIDGLYINGGWGAYSIYENKFFAFNFGPYLSIDLGAREIARNVNKPYSIDFGADLNSLLLMSFSFAGKKTSYRVRYLNYINLIGVQFMPQYWESYYMMDKSLNKNFSFSSLNNRIFLRHELTFDFQFQHSTWRLGARHEYLNYGTNNNRFKRQELSIIVGTLFKYKIDGKVKFR